MMTKNIIVKYFKHTNLVGKRTTINDLVKNFRKTFKSKVTHINDQLPQDFDYCHKFSIECEDGDYADIEIYFLRMRDYKQTKNIYITEFYVG